MSPLTLADVPLRYRQTEDPATLAEAVALAGLVDADAPGRLVEWLRDRLESAGSPVELAAEWRRVVRYGTSVPRAELLAVALGRLDRLEAEAERTRARSR